MDLHLRVARTAKANDKLRELSAKIAEALEIEPPKPLDLKVASIDQNAARMFELESMADFLEVVLAHLEADDTDTAKAASDDTDTAKAASDDTDTAKAASDDTDTDKRKTASKAKASK